MTTTTSKRPGMVKVPEKKYVRLQYSFTDLPGCCGAAVAYGFNEHEWRYDYNDRTPKQIQVPKEFDTKEEQAEAMRVKLEERCIENKYYYVQIVLVKQYANGEAPQLPVLGEVLLKNGWVAEREWVAPRHGNKLVLYSKILCDADKQETGWMDGDEDESDNDW